MNVLTTTWRQLVRRRLWPVALLLVAALAAVPVLLARDAEPVAAPAPGPVVTAKTDDTIATPVVQKVAAEDRDKRRRVLGARKDPFTPAAVKKPKTAKTVKKSGPADAAKDTGGTPVSTAPTTTSPVTPIGTTTPAPKPKTYAKGSLIVRFGDAEGTLTRMNLTKLSPLPKDEDPLLVYMRLTDHGKKAVFLVDAALEPTGDGTCQPHPSDCETVELAKGETEFFDIVDPETGEITAQYELDLVDIK